MSNGLISNEMGKVVEHWSKELGGADIEIPQFDSVDDMIEWLQAVINYLKEIQETEKEHPVIISEVFIHDQKIQITFGESGLCSQSADDEEEVLKVPK